MNAPVKPCFVDTNVLLYGFDEADPAKQRTAQRWLECFGMAGGPPELAGSERVLFQRDRQDRRPAESHPWHRQRVSFIGSRLGFNFNTIQRAWHWMDHAGVTYWDGLILAAAENSSCRWLLSEDFQDGRKYGSVQVINPFRTDPEQFLTGRAHSRSLSRQNRGQSAGQVGSQFQKPVQQQAGRALVGIEAVEIGERASLLPITTCRLWASPVR